MQEDDRLIKALAHANYRATIVQQRENLKVRYASALLYSTNGGTFTVRPEIITWVDTLIRHGQTEVVVIDDKGMPVKITDLQGFLDEMISIYAEASNEYHTAWEALRKARSVEAVISV